MKRKLQMSLIAGLAWTVAFVAGPETSGRMDLLPSLDVRIDLPDLLRQKDAVLEILDSGRRVVHSESVDAAAREIRVGPLPKERLIVILEGKDWSLLQYADLGDGLDAQIEFAPQPIHLSGEVHEGDEPAVAKVTLMTGVHSRGKQILAHSDERGDYEVVLWQPGTYLARVEVEGRLGSAYSDVVQVPAGPATVHDFRFSDARWTVQVLDRSTGDGIAGAEVVAENQGEDGLTRSLTSIGDEDGTAHLQPMRGGSVIVHAQASGFRPSEEKRFDAEEGDADTRHWTLQLEPVGETATVRLRSSATPVVGAEACLVRALDDITSPLWTGSSDRSGELAVPVAQDSGLSYLVIRHPSMVSTVRPWTHAAAGEALDIHLGATFQSLILRTTAPSGDATPRAQIALWIDGHRVSGTALAWLTHGRVASSSMEGVWRGNNLPVVPTRVLAWSRDLRPSAVAGALDGLAQTLTPSAEIQDIEIIR